MADNKANVILLTFTGI